MSALPECTVFIAAEGPSEIGDLSHPLPYREGKEGYFQPLLRKLCGGRVQLKFDGAKIASLPKARDLDVKKGHGRKAAQALALARTAGARALVYVKDVDKLSGTKASARERRRKQRELREAIEAGFEASEADDGPQRIVATPCRMIENWALGDPDAFKTLDAPAPKLPAAPEELWGDEKDPKSNHPKCVIRRALDRSPSARDFADLADASDVTRLAKSCPESFEPFAEAVKATLAKCLASPSAGR